MPNHVQNRMQIIGDHEKLKEVREFIRSEESELDFNRIIPMPEDLIIQNDPDDPKPLRDIKKQEKANKEKYGYKDWYDWSVDHWGTKWNAYELDDERSTEDTIYFQTAWATPFQVMEALAGRFPELTFRITYADEELGYNCGMYTFSGGKLVERVTPDKYSRQAYEISFEMWPGMKDEFLLEGNQYVSKDEKETKNNHASFLSRLLRRMFR